MTPAQKAEAEKRDKRRREYEALVLLFGLFAARLADTLSREELTAAGFISAMADKLYDAHADAWQIGRDLSGGAQDGPGAQEAGAEGLRRDEEYLQGFQDDLEKGKYVVIADDAEPDGGNAALDTDAVAARAASYGKALYASTNLGFLSAIPTDASIEWHLEPGADHCDDCLLLAANSPYTMADLPTFPGGNATKCEQGCRCRLSGGGFTGMETTV